jgi:hypothetical protein
MRLLDAKLPGIKKLFEDIVAARDRMRQSPVEETIKTAAEAPQTDDQRRYLEAPQG